MPGRFLATLTETRPDRGSPYPYVNVPAPIGRGPGPEEHQLLHAIDARQIVAQRAV